MVSGIRSPFSCSRRIRNWPGFCLRAMRGASMTKLLDVEADGAGFDNPVHEGMTPSSMKGPTACIRGAAKMEGAWDANRTITSLIIQDRTLPTCDVYHAVDLGSKFRAGAACV